MIFALKILGLWCLYGILVGIAVVFFAKHKKCTNAELIDACPEWTCVVLCVAMCPLIIMTYVWRAVKGDW